MTCYPTPFQPAHIGSPAAAWSAFPIREHGADTSCWSMIPRAGGLN